MTLTAIGFDADDTLWHNERFFQHTQAHVASLLGDHVDASALESRLHAAEVRNLGIYGFGVKGFTLSLIETAIEVSEGRIPARVIAEILEAGREMLRHPVEILPHARETIEALAGDYRIILVTKGDLLDQERKLAASGLGDLFDAVEIVSDKTPEVYQSVFRRHANGADQAMMVGNSLKSDVLPMISAGGWGVHVPHDLTCGLEHADPPQSHPRFAELPHLGALAGLIGGLR
ncbi:HAD family hydrolase [Paenirhodobacter populi]|uniref:HAD family hydrolase n=1 Tax=Paenirhodobacter populi TaxID=2306993 RepID=UPI000FE38687|nr:HAD family hydrolase [Sinirhodobacter populi]RWR11571.1 HAD family hydrolase [Sinirhodobacter populi]